MGEFSLLNIADSPKQSLHAAEHTSKRLWTGIRLIIELFLLAKAIRFFNPTAASLRSRFTKCERTLPVPEVKIDPRRNLAD